jgi:hypothetical protein
VIGMLNSVLWSKNILVPGFSPKYFTIWGRNMDTKHTTGEQIAGNWDGFLEKIWEKIKERKVRNVTIREVMEVRKNILGVIEEKRLRWFDM